ncbi:hypothetical protein PMAYCL1PPCAC_30162, partial [Pristionchus mayeri]
GPLRFTMKKVSSLFNKGREPDNKEKEKKKKKTKTVAVDEAGETVAGDKDKGGVRYKPSPKNSNKEK